MGVFCRGGRGDWTDVCQLDGEGGTGELVGVCKRVFSFGLGLDSVSRKELALRKPCCGVA